MGAGQNPGECQTSLARAENALDTGVAEAPKRRQSQLVQVRLNLDELMPYAGEFGKFQVILQILFCIAVMPTTFPALIMYFAALEPDWKCVANNTICLANGSFPAHDSGRCNMPRDAWEYTQPRGYSIITQFDIYCSDQWKIYVANSIYFLACSIGAVVLGWVADTYGRKKILFPSLVVVILVGFASAFSPNIWVLIVSRFVVGFFVPATYVQMFVLISEMAGPRYRARAGLSFWMFCTVAWLLMCFKAYLVQGWKMLFILCTAPYVFVLASYFYVPESIRWLLLVGKSDEAMGVVKRIARLNGRNLSPAIQLQPSRTNGALKNPTPVDLFRTHAIRMSSLNQGQGWLFSGLLYYGLSLAADDLGGSLYVNFVLIAVVEFPALLLAMYCCDRFGRKKTIIIAYLLSGISCGLVATAPSTGHLKAMRVFLGMLGKFCITLSFNSMYTWSVEIYPTRIRSLGMGYLQVTSRIGAALAPWVAEGLKSVNPRLPFVIMGILTVISAICLLRLPETKGRAEDSEEEPEGTVLTVRSFKSYQSIKRPDHEIL